MSLYLLRMTLFMMMSLSQSFTAKNFIASRFQENEASDTINLSLSNQKQLEELNIINAQANIRIMKARLEVERSRFYVWVTGLSLALFLFLFIMYRYYITQRLKESVLRNKIASDLHDDIGATLSSISIFSEVAFQKIGSNDPSALEVVTKIGDSSRSLLENMDDVVWSINSGNDTIQAVKERILLAGKSLLSEMDIDFRVYVAEKDEQIKLNMNQRKNLYLIFKESLNNCAKYSRASQVEVSLKVIKNKIELTISDNGIGFDARMVKYGNGVNNMKKRSHEIGGQLQIESSNTGGCNIKLSFPLS